MKAAPSLACRTEIETATKTVRTKVFRKDAVKRVYHLLGEGCARILGENCGLKESTLNSWFSTWRNQRSA